VAAVAVLTHEVVIAWPPNAVLVIGIGASLVKLDRIRRER
jgi:hypothetical protein